MGQEVEATAIRPGSEDEVAAGELRRELVAVRGSVAPWLRDFVTPRSVNPGSMTS